MRSRTEKRGFTLIELLVVIAIIAILASILFPVFAKAREKARQTTCLSQVRQLATAFQMYSQDNNAKYPGVDWTSALDEYIGHSKQMFWCPSDTAVKGQDTSYGYSGLLVDASGSGVPEAAVKAPTEVGILCDAEPARSLGQPGLVGGGALTDTGTFLVTPKARHSKGIVVGYADGHAKYVNAGFAQKDASNAVTRAFYMAPALGFIENYAGGISGMGSPVKDTATYVLGGDSACEPIITAAAAAYKGSSAGSSYASRGFNGLRAGTSARSGNFIWGNASGVPGATSVAIGYDAMVLIVAKGTKIKKIAAADIAGEQWFHTTPLAGTHAVNSAEITYLFTTDMTAYNSTNTYFNAYTFKKTSGSRDFFLSAVDSSNPIAIAPSATEVENDLDMVDKVSNDPYGIGYCSAAFADTERVEILGICDAAGANAVLFPQTNPKYHTLYNDGLGTWPMGRTLYADLWSATLPGNDLPSYMLGGPGFAALNAGPLFQASYFSTL